MADPGDPHRPQDQAPDDHDDLIGFTSPSSLRGVGRAAVAPEPEPNEDADRDLFDPPAPRPQAIREWARETRSVPSPAPTPTSHAPRSPRFDRTAPPEGAMGLYAVYALILFAVPTMGVSAVIALLAVTVRPAPTEPFALGHFLFQKRTLWIAGIGAAIGVVLIAVNLGVFVLFLMAVWVLVRGTWGVLRLASGKPVANPKTWLI